MARTNVPITECVYYVCACVALFVSAGYLCDVCTTICVIFVGMYVTTVHLLIEFFNVTITTRKLVLVSYVCMYNFMTWTERTHMAWAISYTSQFTTSPKPGRVRLAPPAAACTPGFVN